MTRIMAATIGIVLLCGMVVWADFFIVPGSVSLDHGRRRAVCYNSHGPAALSIVPASRTFGNTTLGHYSTATLVVRNTGESAATGLTLSALTSPFSTDWTRCGTTLAAFGNCSTQVRFAPTQAKYSSTTFTASYAGGSATATIAGIGSSNQIVTVSNTSVTGDLGNIYDTLTKGQSFKSPVTGHLVAYRFKSGTSLGTAPVAAIRCGTSTDLTTAAEYTVAITTSNTVYGVTLTAPIAVTTGQTVYCGVRNTKTTYTDRLSIQYANPGTYADGAEYQAASWALTGISAYDLWFEGDFQ